METLSDPVPTGHAAPSAGALFGGFLMLGLTGFGGVLPMARRMLVERRGWLTGAEFVDMLGLCQFLPGGNIINLSVAVGLRFQGVGGAVSALLGLIAAPTLIVIALGSIYDRYGNDPHVRHLFAGLASAAAGLLVALAVRMVWPLRRRPAALLVVALCLAAIAGLRLSLLPCMAVLAPLSILLARRFG